LNGNIVTRKVKEFEMSEDDLNTLMKSMKPTPYILGSGGVPLLRTTQERANDAWGQLGQKLGFKHMTVEPITGKGDRFFKAEEITSERQHSDQESKESI